MSEQTRDCSLRFSLIRLKAVLSHSFRISGSSGDLDELTLYLDWLVRVIAAQKKPSFLSQQGLSR